MKFIDINTNDLFYLLGEANSYISQSVEWDSLLENEPMRNYSPEDEKLWYKDLEMSFRDEVDDDEDDDWEDDEDDEDEDEDEDDWEDEDDDWEDDEDEDDLDYDDED
jgi:hypothetical protein